MIDFIIQCLAVCLSISIGIVFVYGGCKAISRLFDGRGVPCGIITVKNFIADGNQVDVTLSDGRMVKGQKFVGFADFGTQKQVPYDFKTWLVLETESGRTFIKPQTIRMISEIGKLEQKR